MSTLETDLEHIASTEEREALLELLFEQKRALDLERARRLRAETILAGLEQLVATPNARDAFDNLVAISKPLLEFEHALLVSASPDDDHSFFVDFSTHADLDPLRWTTSSFWEHALGGEPIASFNVALVPEWRDALKLLAKDAPTIRSALHVSLSGLSRQALFVCVHSKPAFFSSEHLERVRMLSPLAAQLLINQERLQARQAEERAQQASQAKSTFLANMSHELRTPLTAIIGYSEIVLEESLDRGHTDHVEDIENVLSAASHLLDIISDVLDLSKIEAGHVQLDWSVVDLAALLEEARHMIEPMVAERCNTLTLTNGSTLPTHTVLDEKKTRQVLLNLLSNAAKFTRDGEVRLDVRRSGERLVFAISDTGIGISEEKQRRLFEAFERVHDDAHEVQGTGIGLALSRELVRRMGGDITVESTPGKGSTFTMWLPERTELHLRSST